MAKAPTKKPGTAMVKWEEELANLAKDTTKDIESSSGKFISLRGGVMSFNGDKIPDNELRCVIVGVVNENQFYDEKFDPNSAQVPACYAFGTKREDMAPTDDVFDKQNDACATCPHKEWGSDLNGGEGKACKDVVRIALIAESDLDDMDSAEVVYLKIPTMSVKSFNKYLKDELSKKHNRPYWSVITQLSLIPDPQAQFKLTYARVENIEDSSMFQPLKDLWEDTMEGIAFPYPKREVTEKPARGKKAPAKAAKFVRK